LKARFLPQDADVQAAYLELEGRRERGDDPPVIARVVCHGRTIGRVWNLGPGRSLFVAKNERTKPTRVGGGEEPRKGQDRLDVIEACFPEVVGDPVEEIRMMPKRCPAGHRVLLPRSVLREAVERYRQSGGSVMITLRIDRRAGSPPLGVLGSVK
jgi:hypothetical protein